MVEAAPIWVVGSIFACAYGGCTILAWIAQRLSLRTRATLTEELQFYRTHDLEVLEPGREVSSYSRAVRAFLQGLFVAVCIYLPMQAGLQTWPYVFLAGMLFVLAWVDLDNHVLPPIGVDLLVAVGLLLSLLNVTPLPLDEAVLGALLQWACWTLITAVLHLVFGHADAMGDGDIRLLVAIGAWTGLMSFAVSTIAVGLALGCRGLLRKQRGIVPSHLPFGPAIAAATYLHLIFLHLQR